MPNITHEVWLTIKIKNKDTRAVQVMDSVPFPTTFQTKAAATAFREELIKRGFTGIDMEALAKRAD